MSRKSVENFGSFQSSPKGLLFCWFLFFLGNGILLDTPSFSCPKRKRKGPAVPRRRFFGSFLTPKRNNYTADRRLPRSQNPKTRTERQPAVPLEATSQKSGRAPRCPRPPLSTIPSKFVETCPLSRFSTNSCLLYLYIPDIRIVLRLNLCYNITVYFCAQTARQAGA